MIGSFDLLFVGLIVSLALAGAGRILGRSPASWSVFPFLSGALFVVAFAYSWHSSQTIPGSASASGSFSVWPTALIAIGYLALPAVAIYYTRRFAAGIVLIFALLFALDIAEQMGFTAFGISIARPLGYSYFLFRLFDALRSRGSGWKSWLLQATAFPTLPAGPILLGGQFRILTRPFTLTGNSVFYRRALLLLIFGTVKLYVLLPLVQLYLETGLIFPLRPSAQLIANFFQTGVYLYLRLFLDFSGYTDLIVAMCAFLGLKIRHNFLRPYAAVTLRDFWRRWHITLAYFMRRHIYIPLGGSRDGRLRHARNLILVFALIGVWHGLTGPFLIWGLLHALYLISEAYLLTPAFGWLRESGPYGRGVAIVVQYCMTQVFVGLSWIVFFWK